MAIHWRRAAQAGLIACIAMAAWSTPSPAADPPPLTEGNGLKAACEDGSSNFEQGECLGYLQATHFAYQLVHGREPGLYCMPQGVRMGQVRDIVLGYLVKHPERRQADSTMLIIFALADVFPCPQSPPSSSPAKP